MQKHKKCTCIKRAVLVLINAPHIETCDHRYSTRIKKRERVTNLAKQSLRVQLKPFSCCLVPGQQHHGVHLRDEDPEFVEVQTWMKSLRSRTYFSKEHVYFIGVFGLLDVQCISCMEVYLEVYLRTCVGHVSLSVLLY